MFRSTFLMIIMFTSLNLIQAKSSTKTDIPQTKSLCLIKNEKYTDEYLYSSLLFDEDMRIKLYTNEIDPVYMNSPLQAVWILEPTNYQNETHFYISNFYQRKYHLCATNDHVDRFEYRRKVRLEKYEKGIHCLWRFEILVKKNKSTLNIWNLKHMQPLYAASFFFKASPSNRRNVFLWNDKPDSDQFNWKINCESENFSE